MALVLADRVLETCTSPGTGAVTLLGAATGYQTFSSGIGNGNTCYYCIADQGGTNWEVGIGTYSSSGNTLTRTTPISGSGSTPVNFSSGTQNVFVTYPAEKSVNLDASGKIRADSNNYLDFASAAPSKLAGRMWYNNTDGTWNLVMGGGNITQQVGEEQFIYGEATSAISGDSILQLIFKTGVDTTNGVLKFAPTTAGITDSNLMLGVGTEDIAGGAFGRITTFGIIHGIDTTGSTYSQTWAAADVIWYDPTTGGLTNVKPVAPNIKYQVGTVLIAGTSATGTFQVQLSAGSVLGGTDSNVQFSGVSTGNLIQYNGTYWTNVVASSVVGGAAGSNTQIQYNNSGALGASSLLTFDGTTFNTPNSVITSSSSSDALRITQTGSGNALLVEDSANPDATPFVVASDGKVGIGTNTPVVPLQLAYTTGAPDASLLSTDAIVVTAEETAPGFVFVVAGSSSGNRGVFKATRARGTLAAPIAPNSGDNVFSLLGSIYDGTTTRATAAINMDVDGTVSSGVAPQRISFLTGSASSRVEAMRINSAQNIAFGYTGANQPYHFLDAKTITGGVTSGAFAVSAAVQSDVTTTSITYGSTISTAASAFTLGTLQHFRAAQSTIGAGSSVTTQYGYYADSTLTGATNNYGFYGNIAAGTGRYNFYAAGSADNYFAGSVGIGNSSPTGSALAITKNITGATTAYGVATSSTVQSDVTSVGAYYATYASTQAASFTLSNLRHYAADQGTIGAGSTVTGQYGFWANSSLTGATNNYGFYSAIASGTGRYNFYAAGTADNYFAGSVGIGATPATGYKVDVASSGDTILRLKASGQSNGLELGQLTADGGNKVFAANNNYLIFGTNNTERMRIDSSGQVGIGGTPTASVTLDVQKVIGIGAATAYGVWSRGTVSATSTTSGVYFRSDSSTAASAFTVSSIKHFSSAQGTFGAGSTATNQLGFSAESSLTGATNNYGFYSSLAAATGAWNFYAAGTAANYFGGVTTVGKALQETKTAIAASAIDLSTGNYFSKTIAALTTFTVSNVPTTGTSSSFILDLTNGGAFTITWWTGVKWAGGTAPTLTAAGRDVLGFFTYDGGTTWSGFVLGKDLK